MMMKRPPVWEAKTMRQVAFISLLIESLATLMIHRTVAAAPRNLTRTSPIAITSNATTTTTGLLSQLGFDPRRTSAELQPVAMGAWPIKSRAAVVRGESQVAARRARLSPFPDAANDDDRHHRQLDSRALSDEQSPREDIAQAKRASQNVKRRLDLVDSRMEQIESRIEADQRGGGAPTTSSGQPTSSALVASSDFSTPFNYNLDSDQPDGSPLAGQDQTERPVSSAPNGVVHNIEPPQGDSQWSPTSEGDGISAEDQQQETVSGGAVRSAKQVANNETKWSMPIIRSVVSARQNPSFTQDGETPSSPMEETSNEQQDLGSRNKGDEIASGEQQTATARRYDHQAELQDEAGQQDSATQSQNQTTTTSQGNRYASGPLIDSQSIGGSSMMGPEWSPNENYQYFNELNARNHANGVPQTTEPGRQTDTALGSQAFRASPSQPSRGRFQNMSITYSAEDLANSSNQQQAHQLSPPQSSTGSPLVGVNEADGTSATGFNGATSSTRRPPPAAASGDQPVSRNKKGGVSTYEANYNRSSKDHGGIRQRLAGPTTKRPNVDSGAPVLDTLSLSADLSGPSNLARANNTHYMVDSSNVRWPALATAYSASGQPSALGDFVAVNANNGPSSSAYANRYATTTNNQSPDSAMDTTKAGYAETAGNGLIIQDDGKLSARRFSNPIANAGDNSALMGRQGYSSSNRGPNYALSTNNANQQVADYLQYTAPKSIRRASNDQRVYYQTPNANSYASLQADDSSGPNSSYDLKHRSSTNSDDGSMNQSQQDSTSDRNSVQPDQALAYTYGYAQNSDSSQAEFNGGGGGADPNGRYGQTRNPFTGQLTTTSVSSGLNPQEQRNFYNTANSMESLLGYANQPTSASQASSGSPDIGAQVSRTNALGSAQEYTNDSEGNKQSAYEQQQLIARANARNSYQQQLADSMQSAATTTNSNNNLLRNQQLSRIDLHSLLDGYQQQLMPAAQIQQQQQQLQSQQQQVAQLESQLNAMGVSLQPATYQAHQQSHPQGRDTNQNVYRRYAPDTYQAYARSPSVSSASGSYGADSSQLAASDLASYSTASSNFQPVYTASSYPSAGASDAQILRLTNLALQRAAMAAASRSNSGAQQQFDQQSALLANAMLPYLAGQSAGSAQSQTSGAGNANNNYSAQGGGLYATSAMSSPTFYEASQTQQQQQQQPKSGTDSTGATEVGRQQYASSATAATGLPAYRRGLTSLFKPSASSRYYYAPTILSPISLGSSAAAMHSLYAPAALAAEPMTAASLTGQMYAAADPYGQQAAVLDQTNQQYQAYAAAAGLQPTGHYMAEPDMAESSLTPDSGGYAPDLTSVASPANSASSDSAESGSQSSSKSGKGLTPWTNIAGLLLGILPFGILMASFLPPFGMAGRKKRELDFGARNFSDLLKWRPPSKVLSDLIEGFRQESANSTNPVAFGGELGKLGLFGPLGNSSGGRNGATKPRSFGARSAAAAPQTSTTLTSSAQSTNEPRDRSSGPNKLAKAGYQWLIPVSNRSDTISTTLSSPAPRTTPMPSPTLTQSTGGVGGGNNSLPQTSGVKAKVWKALSAINNLIVSQAQNMKRKHRSSIIDNQWSSPGSWRGLFALENLLNIAEFKRQLNTIVQTNQLARSWQQQQQQLNQQSQSPTNPNQLSKASSIVNTVNEPNEVYKQSAANIAQNQAAKANASFVADNMQATNKLEDPPHPSTIHQQEIPTDRSVEDRHQIERPSSTSQAPPIDLPETGTTLQDNHARQHPLVVQAASQILQTVRAEPIQVQVKLEPASLTAVGAVQPPVQVAATSADHPATGSKRRYLEECLNLYLCRILTKLRVKLKNPFQGALSSINNRSKINSTEVSPERLEQITKNYMKEIINQIEAKDNKVTNQTTKTGGSIMDASGAEKPEQLLDMLYKNALKNQCASRYNCIKLDEIEKNAEYALSNIRL